MELGIIGGTGKQGFGLAKRLAKVGYHIRIGSRSREKGEQKASELKSIGTVSGGDNLFAAQAEIVVLTIPSDQIEVLLEPIKSQLENKIIIDTIVNLKFGKTVEAAPFYGKSVYEFLVDYLPTSVIVTSFKTISASLLNGDDDLGQSDFLICSNDESFQVVSELSYKIGLQPLKITSSYHAATIERMVALSIQINKTYKNSHCGFLVKDVNLGL